MTVTVVFVDFIACAHVPPMAGGILFQGIVPPGHIPAILHRGAPPSSTQHANMCFVDFTKGHGHMCALHELTKRTL